MSVVRSSIRRGWCMSSDQAFDAEVLLSLRRLAYTILPPGLGRRHRARLADSLARQALTLGATHTTARAHLIREVLLAGRRAGWMPSVLARLGETSTPESRATEKALAAMMPAVRAAFALLHLEKQSPAQAVALLELAGVHDASTSVTIAERTPLDVEALRSLVVPVPTGAVPPRLVAGVAVGLVLAVAAPVIAVTAFDGEERKTPVQVSNALRVDAERESAIDAARAALRDARERAASTNATAEADRSLQRILNRLDAALKAPGVTRKAERRLKNVRQAVVEERRRLQD